MKGGGPPQVAGPLGTPGSPRGRRRGGPTVVPPGTGVKRAGGAVAAARAGTGPASSRPRLRARSPPPGARGGRGGGGRAGEAAGRWGFPCLVGRN